MKYLDINLTEDNEELLQLGKKIAEESPERHSPMILRFYRKYRDSFSSDEQLYCTFHKI